MCRSSHSIVVAASTDDAGFQLDPISDTRTSTRTTCVDVHWSDSNCIVGPFLLGDDIPETVFREVCRKSRGKFPVLHSTSMYVVCHENYLTINQCPPTFQFRPEEEKCSETTQVPEKSPETESPDDRLYRQIVNDNYVNITGSNETQFQDPTPTSLVIPIVSTLTRRSEITPSVYLEPRPEIDYPNWCGQDVPGCDENDYIQVHEHCNKFVICENGRRHIRTCPPGTNFDPINKGCDHAETVDCSSRLTDFGTYACNIGMKYSAPHPDYCNKFIECENGKLFVKHCGGDLVYNPFINACDYKSQVECKNPISLENDIDVNFHSRNPRKSLSYSKCNTPDLNQRYKIVEGGLERYPHPIYCNKFVECENGQRFVKDCGPGTSYDKIKGWCGHAQNSREGILNSCDSFAECHGSLYLEIKCPSGTFFDPQKKQCIANYHCPYIQQISPYYLPNEIQEMNQNYITVTTQIPDTTTITPTPTTTTTSPTPDTTEAAVGYYQIQTSQPDVSYFGCNIPDLDQRYRVLEKGLERYPHPHYCNKFVECENGRRFVKDCGPGTYYDKIKGWCGFKYDTREEIPYSCETYAECQGSFYEEIQCHGSTLFDPQKKKCTQNYQCPYIQQISTVATTTTAPTTTRTTTTPTTTTTRTTPTTTTPTTTTNADYDPDHRIVES
ncbi:unnamed protein product [Allacma fusca]|uniref:Chitin-binding type-2 domain-containing protein n=1 Tax=Allacma fusca TaxID=39272 RepID=A0A8J2JM96_9HEXA|nr:unnamed protein product [Allacma fusca]